MSTFSDSTVHDPTVPYHRHGSISYNPDWNADDGYVVASHDRLDSDASTSVVRVEICDLDERTHTTTGVLRWCQQVILNPYAKLLVVVGWRSWLKDSINYGSWPIRLLNLFYTMVIIFLQLYTFVYQVIACEGKLVINQGTPTTTLSPNGSEDRMATIEPSVQRRQCYHITTTYIVPAVLHFAVYIMGFMHFRVQENEQLYSLMEKVFLRQAPVHRALTQSSAITGARWYFYCGLVWSLLAVALQGLSAAAFGMTPTIWFLDSVEEWWTSFLFAFQLLGFLFVYLVQVAVIVNYAAQCELLIALVNGICMRLREKSTDLRVAMHDILGVREGISMLNGVMARMTAIGVLSFTELTIMGLCLLVLNDISNTWAWMYRALYPIVFGTALLFPLVQAARVASTGDKLKQICFEMRVFGYKDASQLDLDSFVLFVNHASLRTKLFSIPIKFGMIMAFTCGISLILLVLFQMGIIAGANILF